MPPAPQPPNPGQFPSTHWSLVVLARDRDDARAREALAALCRSYWYPLYAYVRRHVHDADRAADLTQEFFVHLLEKDSLILVDQSCGKLRAFLLACCHNFLVNQRQRDAALKRGGSRAILSLDLDDAESRYALEPSHLLTPERLFERRWALTLLERSLDQLRGELERDGKGALYAHLEPVLVAGLEALPCAQIGERLGMSEGAVKKAAQRLRR